MGASRRFTASTQNQALSALIFLYRAVLGRELASLPEVVRAKRPARLPLVLSVEEVVAILRQLSGIPWLMASLMYGAGLRLLECARLRIKDLDFTRGEITVRDGKGRKDRLTVLPLKLVEPMKAHLERVRRQHEADLSQVDGSVELPAGLARKYPRAAWEWCWQWVFPATRPNVDRCTGVRRRHHIHETLIQRAFKQAVASRVSRSQQPATACATVSPPTSSRPGTTSEPFRNCWVTAT